jgi:hypothetical protein
MRPPSPSRPDSDAPPFRSESAPGSESEQRLSARLRRHAARGALPEERANADMAYATGHARGFEEGRDAHLDSLRTVLMRVLEARFGQVEEETLDLLERASLRELEDWIVRAATE